MGSRKEWWPGYKLFTFQVFLLHDFKSFFVMSLTFLHMCVHGCGNIDNGRCATSTAQIMIQISSTALLLHLLFLLEACAVDLFVSEGAKPCSTGLLYVLFSP